MRTLLCFAAILVVSSAAEYCQLDSCVRIGQQQTLCKYPNPQPAQTCGNKIRAVGPTDAEKKMIVDLHNSLRSKVARGQETRGNPGPQPAAINMKTMRWDNELEKVAQRWANQCAFGHDSCRNVQRYSVGQNVGIQSTTGTDKFQPSQIIQSWYDEVALFDNHLVTSFKSAQGVGHYTQMVWADSTEIGCGSIRYTDSDGWNSYYLVCNYGPAGNIIGYPLYKLRI